MKNHSFTYTSVIAIAIITFTLFISPIFSSYTNAANTPPPDEAFDLWTQAMIMARPGLPTPETRSLVIKGIPSDPMTATLDIMETKLGTPSTSASSDMIPTALTSNAEELIYQLEYTASNAIHHAFASYMRPDDTRPFYWVASGFPRIVNASSEQAEQALIKHVLEGKTEGLRVLGLSNIVDTASLSMHKANGDPVSAPWSRFWLFFIDDTPTSNWQHPCRYVFISEDLSAFAIQYARQPIALNDLTLPDNPDQYMNVLVPHSAIDTPQTLSRPSEIEPLAVNYNGSAQNCYVVIISGGLEARQNYIRYWEDSANIYSTLTRKYGFSDDHIYALVSDGTNVADDRNGGSYNNPVYSDSPTDLDNDGDVDVDGPATFTEVEATFTELEGILTSDDQLFVFITDHGSQQAGWDAWVCLWGNTWLRDDQLEDMTDDYPCPVFFALETCFSGGFVDDIESGTDNRVIGAACEFDDTSEGWWHFDPWVYYLTGSFRGFYPESESDPWDDGDVCDVDANGDNKISFREAYDHAWDNRASSDTPQLGENPAGFADELFMNHLHIELSDDAPVSVPNWPQDYSFKVKDYDWACVAIAPTVLGNISGDNNRQLTSPFHTSNYGSTTRDFIVIDGHDMSDATSTFYARALGGSGSCTIEADWEATDITLGTAVAAHSGLGEVMDIFEVYLSANQSYTIDLDVSSGSSDMGLFLYRPSQSLEERSTAYKQVNDNGGGQDEQLSFIAPESGYYGIITIDENGGWANATLNVDIATPLAAPTNVSATDGVHLDKIQISWDSVSGATHYRVYRNSVNNSIYATALNSWSTGTSYDDNTAHEGATYYYWVKAAAGSDGLQSSSYSSVNSGYRDLPTLSDDLWKNATPNQDYFDFAKNANYWWVVGVRGSNTDGDWDIRLYNSAGFGTELKTSATYEKIDFILGDGNHLATTTYGIKCNLYSGTGNAHIEMENNNDLLSINNTTASQSWPAGDVAEVWDIRLIVGTTYRFKLDITSGSADLDIALFSSSGGDYYKNRFGYQARSQNTGALVDESFTYTASATDYYGLCIWARDANSANYTITVEILPDGLWEGDISTDWHTAGNWNNGQVPDSTDDITIPSGCPRYPIITTTTDCRDLSIQSGATLTLNGDSSSYWFHAYGNIDINGILAIANNYANLNIDGDVLWHNGSQLTTTGSTWTEIRVAGDWDVHEGADVELVDGYVMFDGSSGSWIRIFDTNACFHIIGCSKSVAATVGFSALSSASLKSYRINTYSNSTFHSYNPNDVIVTDSIFNSHGHIKFNNGTLVFDGGNPTYDLKLNTGDYLNNLIISCSGRLELDDSYSNTFAINGDVTLESGTLDANGINLNVRGNWSNQVGNAAFIPDGNTVQFTGPICTITGNTKFSDIWDNTTAGTLMINGNADVTNDCTITKHTIVNGTLNVDKELNLNEANSTLEVPTNGTVTAAHFNMGGTLLVSGGEFSCSDIMDPGIFGTVNISGGQATLQQGTGAFDWIDLHGDVILNGGKLSLLGGGGTSWWPYDDDASLTVTDGIFSIPSATVRIRNNTNVTWSSTISGGVLQFGSDLSIERPDFHPTGGICEFMGNSFANLSLNPTSYFHNVVISKTNNTLDADSDLFIHGDLEISSGILDAPSRIEIFGDWNNSVGTAGFNENNSTVCFSGNGQSTLKTNETFYRLELNKSYSGFNGFTLPGITATVNDSVTLLDGTLEMDSGTILDIGKNLTINNGAGLNANDSNTEVDIGGNWNNLNTTFSTTHGFDPGYNSTVIFNSSTTGNLHTAASTETFDNFHVAGILDTYTSITCRDSLIVASGVFDNIGGPFFHNISGDFEIQEAGNWYDYSCTIAFTGVGPQNFINIPGNHFKNAIIEKNTGITYFPLTLQSTMKLFDNGTLIVREGHMQMNGQTVTCTGDVTIEDGGNLYLDGGSKLHIGSGDMLEVQAGGLLDARGSMGNVAIIADQSHPYNFIIRNGGRLRAEHTRFIGMDTGGVRVDAGATVESPYTFNNCTFSNGVAGGTMLALENNQDMIIENAVFPSNAGSGARNVTKITSSGSIDFVHATGLFAGESYDNDTFNLIDWHSGTINAVNIGAPTIATMGGDYNLLGTISGDMPLSPLSYSWTVTDIIPQVHIHKSVQDNMENCSWSTPGPKNVELTVSNQLGTVQAQVVIEVQVLAGKIIGRHWVAGTNAVDLVFNGTSADSTYRIDFRRSLTSGDWAPALPGGVSVTGIDTTTPWSDLGGPGRNVTIENKLFYRATLITP